MSLFLRSSSGKSCCKKISYSQQTTEQFMALFSRFLVFRQSLETLIRSSQPHLTLFNEFGQGSRKEI